MGPARSGVTGQGAFGRPPRISSGDRGFLLGDGLFETIRVYRGVPFYMSAHLDRLAQGAEVVEIPLPSELEDRIGSFLAEVLGGQGGREPRQGEGVLRISLSRGEDRRWGGAAGDGSAGLALRWIPLERSPAWSGDPLTARLQGHIHHRALTATLKGLGYLERITALRRARALGADEALLCNAEGRIVGGSTSNFVGVTRRGALVSPGPAEGARPGVTRGVVLAAAEALGIPVEERGVEVGELAELAEIFLTSSIRELAPVGVVEGRPVGEGRPGPTFLRLRQAFQDEVRRLSRDPGPAR
jgi:branched-subunit amino acid aminotransferase/4-amino-4-deoxychorismate lyase